MKSLSLFASVLFLVAFSAPKSQAALDKLPGCQLPFPIYYVTGTSLGEGCTQSEVLQLIVDAIAIYNAAAGDLELPSEFFYYAGTTADATALCDCGSYNNACDYVNGMNQIVWNTNIGSSIGRMCWCARGDGWERDVTLNPNYITCDTPDEGHAGCMSTILHELGHVLGLTDDSGCSSSVMNYLSEATTLADCDIDSLAARYDMTMPSPLEISNVNVSTSFNSSTYTWDATFTFESNLPALAAVSYDPSMDCYPACSYSYSQSGPENEYRIDHEIVVAGLAPSTQYCYRISAAANPDEEYPCAQTVTGTFNLTNGYANIYSISHYLTISDCTIKASWKTKFPSKSNRLYYRIVGDDIWNYVGASQADCSASRYYTASFPALPDETYEFYVYTKIDGTAYTSSIMQRSTSTCTGGGFEAAERPAPATERLTADPNPCNPSTTITFVVDADSNVELNLYSVDGRLIRTLVSQHCAKGTYQVQWDGTNASGGAVASGIYFASLEMGTEVLRTKILVIR